MSHVKVRATSAVMMVAGARYTTFILEGIRVLVVAKWLGPMQMGIWSTLCLWLFISQFSHLGLLQAQTRELPILCDQGRADEVAHVAQLSWSAIMTVTLSGSILVMVLGVARWLTYGDIYGPGMVLVGLIVPLDAAWRFFFNYLRATEAFDQLGRFMLVQAVTSLILVVVGLRVWGLLGVPAGLLLANLLVVGRQWLRSPFRLGWAWDSERIRRLMGLGIPLFSYQMAVTLFQAVDRIMVAAWLGAIPMGWYSLAVRFGAALCMLNTMVNVVFLPRTIRRCAEAETPVEVGPELGRWERVVTWLFPPFLMLGFVATAWFLRTWYAEYLPSLGPLAWLCVSGYWMIMLTLPANVLVAVGDTRTLLRSVAIGLVIVATLNGAVIAAGGSIIEIAMATAVSCAWYAFRIMRRVFRLVQLPWSLFVRPILWGHVVILGVASVTQTLVARPQLDGGGWTMLSALLVVSGAPAMAYAVRSGVWRQLWFGFREALPGFLGQEPPLET